MKIRNLIILFMFPLLCFAQRKDPLGIPKTFEKKIDQLSASAKDGNLQELHKILKSEKDSTSAKYLYTLKGLSDYYFEFAPLIDYSYHIHKTDSVLYYTEKGNRLAQQNSYLFYRAIFLYIQSLYFERENFYKSRKKAQEIVDLYSNEKLNMVAYAYVQIASMYYKAKKYDKAINALKKAEKISESFKDDYMISLINNNIGLMYTKSNRFEDGQPYYDKSNASNKTLKDTAAMLSYHRIKKDFHIQKKNLDSVNYHYKKGFEINGKPVPKNATYVLNDDGEVVLRTTAEWGKDFIFDDDYNQIFEQKALKALEEEDSATLSATYLAQSKKLKEEGKEEEAAEYFTKYEEIAQKLRDKEVAEQLQLAKIDEQQKALELEREKTHYQELSTKQNRILAFVLGALLLLVLGSSFLYLRNISIKSSLKEAQLEQKLMRSQMNPHFIFNSLSSIQTLILQQKNKQAVGYLSKFSKLVRAILENSLHSFVPLEKEIDALENYLSLQKARFMNDLEYEINLPKEEEIEDINIPPMLIQPFVENAIEHGLRKKLNGGKISLNFKREQNLLHCTIEDNGVGLAETKEEKNLEKTSVSTAIIRERLNLLGKQFKSKTYLDIQSRLEGGTIVKLGIAFK